MATLPSTLIPIITSYNKAYNVNVLKANFGGGYTQRSADGINTIQRDISVEFIGSDTDIDTYVAFFEARNGHEAFEWTPPDESSELKWTCEVWQVRGESENTSRLTATFHKEFDLV